MPDSHEYEALIQPLQQRLSATVWRVLRNAHDADDALQNTLTTIWRQWSRVKSHPNPKALILKVCADCAYDQLRRQSRQREHLDVNQLADSLASSVRSPLQHVEANEYIEELMIGVGRLSRNQAIAIVMRFVQQESYQEIAAALGCGEATARKHVARGRARLSQLLPHLTPYDVRDAAEQANDDH